MLWHSSLGATRQLVQEQYTHEADFELPNGAIYCKHCEQMMRSSNGFDGVTELDVCVSRLSTRAECEI